MQANHTMYLRLCELVTCQYARECGIPLRTVNSALRKVRASLR